MNLTKTALIGSIASAMLMLSSQVFASDTINSTRVVETADVNSQSAAYELAFDTLEALQADSSSQLNRELGHIAPDSRSLTLNDGAYITVAEKMNGNGEIVYSGLVNVNVSYDIAD